MGGFSEKYKLGVQIFSEEGVGWGLLLRGDPLVG